MPTCKGDREGNREIERAGKIRVTTGGGGGGENIYVQASGFVG
jgi:hypothetical protein